MSYFWTIGEDIDIMKKLQTLLLFLTSFSIIQVHAVSPLSKGERFICRGGLQLIGKEYVLAIGPYQTYRQAFGDIREVERYLDEQIRKSAYFHKYQLGIVTNVQTKEYFVVHQFCYTDHFFSFQASSNAALMNYRTDLPVRVFKAHTNRFQSSRKKDRDYLKLVESFPIRQ